MSLYSISQTAASCEALRRPPCFLNFERFPIIIYIAIIWFYAIILTTVGAYRHSTVNTQTSCRTDMANLISTPPWGLELCWMVFLEHAVDVQFPFLESSLEQSNNTSVDLI
ncbi:hypothetical protein RND81_12G094800 [Saponaria officinalis]|uniref:Uncharacterized protein n=1 Tax=Saponaria officinalis TaxID=3572 RepID=A0AAW1H8H1_SAPOF